MKELDDLDFRIIGLLQENGRRPSVEIAKILGVSEATIRRRVQQLLDDDVMRISAVSNPLKLGFPVVVILGLKVDRAKVESAAEFLASLVEVRFLAFSSGPYNLVFEAWFGSNKHLLKFLSETLSLVDGIVDSEVTHLLEMIKYTYDWGKGDVAGLAKREIQEIMDESTDRS